MQSSAWDGVCFREEREGEGEAKGGGWKEKGGIERDRKRKRGRRKMKSYKTISTMHYRARTPHTLN